MLNHVLNMRINNLLMSPFNLSFITLHRDSTTQVNTLCERELSAFILVEPVLLFDNPCNVYPVTINAMLKHYPFQNL